MTVERLQERETQHKYARWTTVLLYTCMALDLVAIAAGFSQRTLLLRAVTGEGYTQAEADANDSRYSAIARLQLVAFVLTGIVWLFWLYRAYSTLTVLGTRKSRFTPGWAVGYWFIPFVNLVRPYQIVVDLWLRSASLNATDSVEHLPRPALVGWWWAVYLLTGAAGRLYASFSRLAESVSQLITVTDIGMVGDAIGIVAAVLAIGIVRKIDRLQQRFEPQAGEIA